MDVINLSLAVGLPWFVGVVWLRYQWREAPDGAWAMVLGYGYVAGILFTTLIMRGLDLFGLQLGFLPIALILSGFAFLGLQLTRDIPWPWRRWAGGWTTTAWSAQERWKKGVFIFLIMVLAVRTIDLGLELIWNPLFAWDAWATWAPKARVLVRAETAHPFRRLGRLGGAGSVRGLHHRRLSLPPNRSSHRGMDDDGAWALG